MNESPFSHVLCKYEDEPVGEWKSVCRRGEEGDVYDDVLRFSFCSCSLLLRMVVNDNDVIFVYFMPQWKRMIYNIRDKRV
jgi:hypothetical protein